MKRLMNLSYTLLVAVLIILSSVNFPYEIRERIEEQKQLITIEKPEEVENKEFLKTIEETVKGLNTDIMYRYVKVYGSDLEYEYYRTAYTSTFVKKSFENILQNIKFYSLSEAESYDLTTGTYYISKDKAEQLIIALREVGYNAAISTTVSVTGKTSVILFTVIPIFLMIMSMVFYTLSNGKKNMLKKMEGYTLIDIALEELRSRGRIFLVILGVVEIFAFSVNAIRFKVGIWEYCKYECQYLVIGLIVCLAGSLISFVVIAGQKKVDYIKGKIPKKGIYYISMLAIGIFLVFIVFFMSISLRNIKTYYNTYRTAQFMSDKIEGYVTIPIYENSASSVGLENNYLDFYKKTVKEYGGVLVDASNYEYDITSGTTLYEEYGQDSIIVNSNYLTLNPIYNESGEMVSVPENSNSIYVLLPLSKINEKEKYEEMVKNSYSTTAVFIEYDEQKTSVYSYNAAVGNKFYGMLEAPVILVINENYLTGIMAYSYCSQGSYFIKPKTNQPYEEMLPLLEETGILIVTPQIPYISANFSEVLKEQADMFFLYGSQTLVLVLGLLCLIVFSGVLYCENDKSKIVSQIIEGYSLGNCICKHLIITFGIYILSFILSYAVGVLMCVSMNYYVILGAMILNIVFTCTICRRSTIKNVYSIVKGAE